MAYRTVTDAADITAAGRVHQVQLDTGTLTISDGSATIISLTGPTTWADGAGYPLHGLTVTASPDANLTAIIS